MHIDEDDEDFTTVDEDGGVSEAGLKIFLKWSTFLIPSQTIIHTDPKW